MDNLNDDELMRAAMGGFDDQPSPPNPKPIVPPSPPVPPKPPVPPAPPVGKVTHIDPPINNKNKFKALPIAVIALIIIASATFVGVMFHSNIDSNDNASDNNYDTFFSNGDEAEYYEASSLTVGDYFELGEYPQDEVTDTRLIAYLDDQTVSMQSYNVDDITYNYGDFEYEGIKYRRVNFTRDSDYRGLSDKYEINTNYYFIWKPILWDIIGEVDGQWQIITDMVLDGKPMDFNSNYWVNTECREWLSTTFMNDAFDEHTKSIIETTDTSEDDYSSEDQVYLLSYAEATDGHFGFSEDEDISRQTKATDYGAFFAKWSHYDYLNGSDDCPYYLRSIEHYSDEYGASYYSVGDNDSGFIDDEFGYINSNNGIRPTCRINKNARIPI